MRYCLGLLPHTPKSTDLALPEFWTPDSVSSRPDSYGVTGLNWGMLGNDEWGDCYWASACHETMALRHGSGREPDIFTTDDALNTYGTYLGVYGEAGLTRENDRGTDAREGAGFRRSHGIEAKGYARKIGGYAFLNAGTSYADVLAAIYSFGVGTVCIEAPESIDTDFDSGVWDYEPGSPIIGGHAVAGVAVSNGQLVVVSWGKEVVVTEEFLKQYLQTVVVYVTGAALGPNGTTPAGLNKAAYLAALHEVTA